MSRYLIGFFLIIFNNAYSQYSANEYYELGRSRINEGKYFEAVDFLTRALESNPELKSSLELRGQALYEIGEYSKAVSDFTHIIDAKRTIDATSSGLFLIRGIARVELRDFEEAKQDFNMAIKLNPLFADAYYERGRLKFLTLKDKNEAIHDIDISIRINPDKPEYFVRRAEYKAYISKFGFDQKPMMESAIRDLSFAIYITPKDYDLYDLRSQYNKELGDPLAAVEDYSRMIDLKPEFAGPYAQRGIIKMQYDDYESAIEDFTYAIDLNPEKEENYRYRGLCRYNSLDYQGAFKDYSESITMLYHEYEISTEKIKVQRLLADTYLKRGVSATTLGNQFNACDDFRRAYELGSKKGINYMRKYCGL